MNLLSR